MREPSPSVPRPPKFVALVGRALITVRPRICLGPERIPNMTKILTLLFVQFLFFGLAASAQTVSPIIVECGKKCRGEFFFTNNGLAPPAVTVGARSFSFDPLGHAINRPLDPGVDLRLEE